VDTFTYIEAYRYYRLAISRGFKALVIAVVLLAATVGSASASFETQLTAVNAAVKKAQHAQTVALLQRLGASSSLEDFRLSLMADALRQAGREAEALQIYERLAGMNSEWLPARQAGLQYVILAAKLRGPSALAKLKNVALTLNTPYQRGRALEALVDLYPAASRDRSVAALQALRAYRSETAFYQNMDESANLLKTIVGSPAGWAFTPDEWIEILRTANREKLGTLVEKALPSLRASLGRHGGVLGMILQAEMLGLSGQRDRALSLLNGVMTTPGLDESVQGLAYQIHGDILSAASRHEQAMADFQHALAWGKPPVDLLAARYRLMRSAFSCGQDQTALAMAEALCGDGVKLSLLPVHLYEMGLDRFDHGRNVLATPWFMLLARYFPGHHRADDALGYAAVCAGTTSPEGKHLLELLETTYPHSFFIYWLNPERRQIPLPQAKSAPVIDRKWKHRSAAWIALLKSPFDGIAREEIRKLLADHPDDQGLFKVAIDSAEAVGEHNLTVAIGEIMMRTMLENGKSAALLPDWAWRAHYPRPWWARIQGESKKYGVDPYWVISIMREESHFNPTILSRSNAHGLMQILPSTGKWIAGKLGIKGKFVADSLWNPDRNIAFGVWYLGYLRDLFNGDLFLAAASYNGGQGNISRKVEQGPFAQLPVLTRLDRVPLPETRDYYKKVMGSWWNYTRIYH